MLSNDMFEPDDDGSDSDDDDDDDEDEEDEESRFQYEDDEPVVEEVNDVDHTQPAQDDSPSFQVRDLMGAGSFAISLSVCVSCEVCSMMQCAGCAVCAFVFVDSHLVDYSPRPRLPLSRWPTGTIWAARRFSSFC